MYYVRIMTRSITFLTIHKLILQRGVHMSLDDKKGQEFSLEDLESTGSEILTRIADKMKSAPETTAHHSHSSHGSGTHTSSN